MHPWVILKNKIFDANEKVGDSLKIIAEVDDPVTRRLFFQAREMKALLETCQELLSHSYPLPEQMDEMGIPIEDPLRKKADAHSKESLDALSKIHVVLNTITTKGNTQACGHS
jgi:hypothetical protein